MIASTLLINPNGGETRQITAIGLYQLAITAPNVSQEAQLAGPGIIKDADIQLACTATATVQLQNDDTTPVTIGDAVVFAGAGKQSIKTGGLLVPINVRGPRFLKVTAIGAGGVLTVKLFA